MLGYFIEHLRIDSTKTAATIANIQRDLERFLAYLDEHYLGEINSDNVRQYINVLEDKYVQASYISKLSSLRQFINWLNPEDNPFWKFKPRVGFEELESYTIDELTSIFEAEGFDYEKLLLELMYQLYLSMAELCALDIADYNSASHLFNIRGATIKINRELAAKMKTYLKQLRKQQSLTLQDPLFIRLQGIDRLKEIDLLNILRKYHLKNTKLKRSRILHLLSSGQSIEEINVKLAVDLSDAYQSVRKDYRLLSAYSKFHPRA